MKPKNPPTEHRRRARSALEYLDQEEQRAVEGLKTSLLAAGEDLCQVTDVRGIVRRHPVLALGASAALGAVVAPFLAEALRGAMPAVGGSKSRSAEAAAAWLRRFAKFG